MIKFDSESERFEAEGDPRTLAAESTFIIKELWNEMFKKDPMMAEYFKFSVMSSIKLCFMTEAHRQEEIKKDMAIGDMLRDILKKMSSKEEKDKKPDVSADFMSDEEFHSFFDKLRGEGEDK